jgi:HK97 gp10 family phage protein
MSGIHAGVQLRVNLEGHHVLQAKLALMPDKVRRKAVLKALKPAMGILRKRARAMAPVGPTGNYKRSIILKTLRGQPPAVSVYPTVKIAPHRWWMEHGTKARTRWKKGIGGKFKYLEPNATPEQRSTGAMPAQHIFRRAWALTQSTVEKVAEEKLWQVIKTGAAR